MPVAHQSHLIHIVVSRTGTHNFASLKYSILRNDRTFRPSFFDRRLATPKLLRAMLRENNVAERQRYETNQT